MVIPGTCSIGIAAGMAALQLFYNPATGLWNSTEWWNAANALEATIDYSRITDSQTYTSNLFQTFEKHKLKQFQNPWFYDDEGWWALTWIKAYDLTGQPRYLQMAKTIFESLKTGWDDTCGGGIWWKKKERTYKNAITNELFLTVAARLHLRTGEAPYRDWAERSWQWIKASGMINTENLVNDGLDSACQNNRQHTWTYNQGVILGGLVDLHTITGDPALLQQAEAIADAALQSLAPQGILREVCEPDCGNDGPQFKGILMRNLAYLYQVVPKPAYKAFLTRNAEAIWSYRNPANQLGLIWAAPVDRPDAARQTSAMDALNAAIAVNTHVTYQAEDGQYFGVAASAKDGGFQGNGYVANWNRDGQAIAWTVEVACAGYYRVDFRYTAAKGAASRYLQVNGRRIIANQVFPATSSWTDWRTIGVPRVWLNAGKNLVFIGLHEVHGNHNALHLDAMTVH